MSAKERCQIIKDTMCVTKNMCVTLMKSDDDECGGLKMTLMCRGPQRRNLGGGLSHEMRISVSMSL